MLFWLHPDPDRRAGERWKRNRTWPYHTSSRSSRKREREQPVDRRKHWEKPLSLSLHPAHTIRLFIRVWLQEEKGSRETFTQTRFVFCSNAHTNTVFSTHFYHTNHWRALLIFPALITQHRIGGYKRETPFYLVPSAMYTISIAMQMCLQHCRARSKNNLFPFSWLKHTSTGIFYCIRGGGGGGIIGVKFRLMCAS